MSKRYAAKLTWINQPFLNRKTCLRTGGAHQIPLFSAAGLAFFAALNRMLFSRTNLYKVLSGKINIKHLNNSQWF